MSDPGHRSTRARASEARPEQFRGQGCRGKCGRCLWHFLQQPPTRNTFYLRAYTRLPQLACALIVSVLFLAFGGGLSSFSGNPTEVVVTYQAGDATRTLTIPKDLTGTVQIHYEIANVLLNNKDYVSGKDKDSVYTFFSTVTCSKADTVTWAQKRRGSDSAFMARLQAGTEELAPCGLVNIALFTDSYGLERDLGNSWEAVSIDESDLALPGDDQSFKKVVEDGGSVYLANERQSWLTPDLLEHWRVWQRTPPGTTVRNLWGVVKGGLLQGEYRLNFTENSPIWDEWGAERRLILTGNASWLGSPSAMLTLAGAMFLLGGLELATFVALVLVGFATPAPVSDVMPAPTQDDPPRVDARPPREPVHSIKV